ncbi:unnamed protein product [Trypanosoma congolense IL3000]|uniref:WGS project CAEQ00000000 data, annotated contig 1285 n=1 Tax=Trypanosoma congolense (strain IL3000) TaxID=1068625 RepID=F9W577_TRYCI|nr:unnamed protein product [Trypanosoma congolense IL3000]
MEAFQQYEARLIGGGTNPGCSAEFVPCCEILSRQLSRGHQIEWLESYACIFAEKVREAVQENLWPLCYFKPLLQLYISLGDGGDTFHIGPFRQAFLRQLYVVHVEELWRSRTTEEKKILVATRRAANRLKTCDPSCYNELVRESGACVMCPQNVLSALREPPSEWEEKMKIFGMDVRQLILSTLGKYQETARGEPCVVEVCENFKKGLREAPGDSIWAEEATLDLFRWLEEIHQEKAKEIRRTFFGLFVGEGEACGTLFLDERNLRPGMTVDRALQLLLVWADILLAKLDRSREGIENYVQALFNLSAADKRLLEELFEGEGTPQPLWLRVVRNSAAEAEFEELERARKRLSEPIYKTPSTTQPTDAQRFLLSFFLPPPNGESLVVTVQEALQRETNNRVVRLETCLCKYSNALLSEDGASEENEEDSSDEYSNWSEAAGQKILEILMHENWLVIPSPEDCAKCKKKVGNPIQRAYKMVEKEGEQNQQDVAKQLHHKEGKLSEETLVEQARPQLQQTMRASRFLHLHDILIKIHEEQCQQPEIVEYTHPKPLRDDLMEKLRDLDQAQYAHLPRPIALEELLSLCEELEKYLTTVPP